MPSTASTSVAAWLRFDPDLIDRELGYARRLGLNAVRVFLQIVAYEQDPGAFLANLDRFVETADRHGLRTLFVLFDSCFGLEPSVALADSKMWVNNPGYSRIAAADWGPLETYVRGIVTRFRGDRRLIGWDVMNEPMADAQRVMGAERDRIWDFCRHFCRFVKGLDPEAPITVGHAAVEYLPRTADLVDVLSVHSYATFPEWLQADLDLARHHGAAFGKPVWVTEFGNPGAGQRYESALDVIERNRLGFFFWELMIGKIMFADQSGLVYPDGTIREPAAVDRLAGPGHGFRVRRESGLPIKAAPDERPLKELLDLPERRKAFLDEVQRAPRTPERILAALPGLGTLGRRLARPRPEAEEAFELTLSIPHHFRLGRPAEAERAFQRLLALVRAELAR